MAAERRRSTRSVSRASSTSSSLEVRCACQYYKSDSLLPERSALARMVQTPPAGRREPVACGDHEYEPIGTPAMRMTVSERTASVRLIAPVVKITDTDVIPVADSDDSIDDRYRFEQRALVLEGDVVLPLDGRIEDNAMDGRNLGDQTVDNSTDELETPQQLQDRLEERFLGTGNTVTDSTIEVIRITTTTQVQQVDTTKVEDEDTGGGNRGFQQRLKSQAGKIRSRLKRIQKPNFAMPHARSKQTKVKTEVTTEVTSKPPSSPRGNQKASRMERFRMALPERPRFSFPDKSKFHLPEKSKFHLPDKSKFHLPERPKFNFPDKSKFHIKKPNIQLPKSLTRPRRSASQRASQSREQSQTSNAESNASSRRNIFDFSTYPRPKLFDRKTKSKGDFMTSSPKESRSQSAESSTFPRAKKGSLSLSARWAQRFGETTRDFHDDTEVPSVERSKPWRHPSLEMPRLSLKPQTSEEEEEKLPWENTERRTYDAEDEDEPEGEQEPEQELSYGENILPKKDIEVAADKEPVKDPRLYDEQLMSRIAPEEPKKKVRLVEEDDGSYIDPEAEDDATYHPRELYDGSFPPVDPRDFRNNRTHSVELSDEEESSMRSDREIQQSSGSSCERRRRGVIEEIDSDEFFLREKGISQENMRYHITSEIRDALRPRPRTNALADEVPPQRPKRTRSHRKRRDESVESFDKPKRERGFPRRSEESFNQPRFERAGSLSSHRIVYQTESSILPAKDDLGSEPLDDIVVVKPVRRKSKSSLGSQSQTRLPEEERNIILTPIDTNQLSAVVPPVPRRRKRLRRDQSSSLSIRTVDSALCNGFGEIDHSHERLPVTPPPTPPPPSREEDETKEAEIPIRRIVVHDYVEPVSSGPPPVPPKRTRSQSRTASLAPEDDRTSHGADSLPGDFGYGDEELPVIPRDSSSREPSLPGYAVIEKRDKPPRPPPPRRKKHGKFATAPRPAKNGPKRPQRAYSTLRPAKSDIIRKSNESMPFIDAEYSIGNEEEFHRELRSGQVMSKMQGRPLPAPPRPPRHKRESRNQPESRVSLPREITPDFSETVASTQTDPLPDDLVIEEEITTAKLIVSPSRSGSTQVLISTERIPSPSGGSYKSLSSSTPPIPPLPSTLPQRDERMQALDTERSERESSPPVESRRIDLSQLDALRSAIFSSEEPLRIATLEVGDLKVDRLTVSQLEAYKVAASEIDAIVVSATELSNKTESEGGIHPSLLQELIAIRNQLEAVASSQPVSRPQSAMEDACTATSNERIDVSPERRPFTRESSPLLIVQQPPSEQEATVEMGRTVFPVSSSMTDLTLTSTDSVTPAQTTEMIVAEGSEEPSSSPPVVQPEEDHREPDKSEEDKPEDRLPISRSRSRSRSASPSRSHPGAVRQTASPVKSLPPVISVTPDSAAEPEPNTKLVTTTGTRPQRALISYSPSRSPPPTNTTNPINPNGNPSPTNTSHQQYTSRIPAEFFALADPPAREPGIAELAEQLFRALRVAGTRSLRNFVDSVVSRLSPGDVTTDEEEKLRRVELAMCALLILVVGLILVCICTPRTVTHHHHWDYFNPPQ